MASRVALRPPFNPSAAVSGSLPRSARVVTIRHPAYGDEFDQNVLLTWRPHDQTADGHLGVHAATVWLACAIVADNAWSGYLAHCRGSDLERLPVGDDDVLVPGDYYFHIPDTHQWPVVPSFADWVFPHDAQREDGPLAAWCDAATTAATPDDAASASSVSQAVKDRDAGCVVSRDRDYAERAHLCPRSELDWFQRNTMDRYNANTQLSFESLTDDAANAIALRPDLHKCFDDRKFVLVRKNASWVPHFLVYTHNLGPAFHNRPVDISIGVWPPFLLARFAWAIFSRVRGFFRIGPARLVKQVEVTDEHGLRQVTRTMTAADFMMQYASAPSPTKKAKRKASDTAAPLPDVRETRQAKRARCSASTPSPTPSLVEDCSDAITTATAIIHDPETAEAIRLQALRENGLRKQRRRIRHELRDRVLFHCDYDAAEKARAEGKPGRPEWGGAHVCPSCSGAEPDDPPSHALLAMLGDGDVAKTDEGNLV